MCQKRDMEKLIVCIKSEDKEHTTPTLSWIGDNPPVNIINP